MTNNARSFLPVVAILLVSAVLPARAAEEPKGCDGFKWPLKHEAELLTASGVPSLASGASTTLDSKAVELKLVDFDGAALPMPPERKPKMTPSRAGFARFGAPTAAGAYQITVSRGAWIDVIQDGHTIKPSAFSGATDCPGVRKSLRVSLAASPLTVQISGTQAESIGLVIVPVP